jgi:hypothetical protein
VAVVVAGGATKHLKKRSCCAHYFIAQFALREHVKTGAPQSRFGHMFTIDLQRRR